MTPEEDLCVHAMSSDPLVCARVCVHVFCCFHRNGNFLSVPPIDRFISNATECQRALEHQQDFMPLKEEALASLGQRRSKAAQRSFNAA